MFLSKVLLAVAIGVAIALLIIFILKIVFKITVGIIGYIFSNLFGLLFVIFIVGYVFASSQTSSKYCLDKEGQPYEMEYVSHSNNGFLANFFFSKGPKPCNEITYSEYSKIKKISRDDFLDSINNSIKNWNKERKQKKMHKDWLKDKDKREIDELRDEIDDLKSNQYNLNNSNKELTIIDDDGNLSHCILEDDDIMVCM